MRRSLLVLICLGFTLSVIEGLIGCATTHMGIKDAVVIKYTDSFEKTVAQQYDYIEKNFGRMIEDWKIVERISVDKNPKVYDKVIIRLLPSGKKVILYFDTTELFDKFVEQREQSK